MNIRYRLATLDDLNVLKSYEQEIIKVERPMDERLEQTKPISYYDIGELIRSENSTVMVGEHEGKIVGTGYAKILKSAPKFHYDEYGYLGFMFVHPDYRGQGINQTIIKKLVNWVRSKNIQEVCLEVYEQNPRAIRAYEKAGFVKQEIVMRLDVK